MKISTKLIALLLMLSLGFLSSCEENDSRVVDEKNSSLKKSASEKSMVQTMEKHLDAVAKRDLETLKSTLSPKGNMQLILPSTEIINTVDGFMDYHEAWFQDTATTWTFDTRILNYEVGERIGIAITEIIYSEPERDGKPYFNRMTVSYALEKIENNWYVIKDHCSSIEKSTDQKE